MALNSFRTLDRKKLELMSNQKVKILIFSDWYLPAFKAGGPIKSVSNFVENFSSEFEIDIFTSDRDLNESSPFKDVKVNIWTKKDDFNIFYASPEFLSFNNIKKIIQGKSYNKFYLNSLLSLKFAIFPLLIFKQLNFQKKVVLAPRGMLGDAALKIKPLKKKLFLNTSKNIGLYKNIAWQASSELEKKEIQKNIGSNANVMIALNLFGGFKDILNEKIKNSNSLKLFFLSRINEKKNLDFALNILKQIKDKEIIIDIYGPIEDEAYWKKCQNIISEMPENIKVSHKGVITFNQIEEKLSPYHFMFLPTKNENFGHVIAEAMSIGCPVIISNETPWLNLEELRVGFDIPLSEEKTFIEKINFAYEMDNETYQIWSKSAFQHVKDKLQNDSVLQQNRALFQ
jgi:glycosyltransferase involved in cell wall biosynthesis